MGYSLTRAQIDEMSAQAEALTVECEAGSFAKESLEIDDYATKMRDYAQKEYPLFSGWRISKNAVLTRVIAPKCIPLAMYDSPMYAAVLLVVAHASINLYGHTIYACGHLAFRKNEQHTIESYDRIDLVAHRLEATAYKVETSGQDFREVIRSAKYETGRFCSCDMIKNTFVSQNVEGYRHAKLNASRD